jgi:hypothetical protein
MDVVICNYSRLFVLAGGRVEGEGKVVNVVMSFG